MIRSLGGQPSESAPRRFSLTDPQRPMLADTRRVRSIDGVVCSPCAVSYQTGHTSLPTSSALRARNPSPEANPALSGGPWPPPEFNRNSIGAPGFEPGTSPTRTARATRLRHAPTQIPVSHTAKVRRRMPTELAEILRELDALLNPETFEDYCPNGLQVPGAEQVLTVVTGVSAHVELFERAREEKAQLILTHHGIFWGSGPAAPIDAAQKRRLKVLFDANMSLAAYHLPLDAHPEVGNNALLARALGADELEPFALHRGCPIGFIARFPNEGIPAEELFARVHHTTSREPLIFQSGPEQVQTVGIVSGAGADFLTEAIARGAQAFLTGEPAERVMAQARESGGHF